MNCRDLQLVLESYLAGALGPDEAESAERHLRECAECCELLELARIAFQPTDPAAARPPEDLLPDVLRATVGSRCLAAEGALCDYVDTDLSEARAELVEAHLSGCADCRALVGALSALSVDLPRLAEIQPDSGFIDAVLVATLPWNIRLRRWWQQSWPRWLVRPRFAAEAAYVTTLILVLVFSVPGSPLEAMPGQVVELARRSATSPISDPWSRLEGAIGSRLDQLKSTEGTRAVLASWRATVEAGSSAASRSVGVGTSAWEWASKQVRTIWGRLASVLERAGETPSPASEDSDEEKS